MENLNNFLKELNLNDIYSNRAQITLSQKKFPQLHYRGHFHRLSDTKKENPPFNWRCINASCKASGKTMSKNVGDELDFIIVHVQHVDSSDDISKDQFFLKKRRRVIKTKASLADEPPRLILNNVENINYSEEVLAKLPSYEANRLYFKREKKEKTFISS